MINTSSYQRELLIKFKGDKLPYLRLKLFDSLAKFKDDLDDSKFNTHIKEIFYLGDKIEAYDKTNGNQLYYTADLLSLWVVNKNENNSFSSGIIFTLPNLKYNPNYVIENTELQNRYLSTVQFGEISFDINLLIEESKQLVKEEGKKNKASYIPRAEFDSRKIEVKDFKITTKPFNIIIQGDYEKTPKHSFPLFDFKVYLAGYKNLLGVYASELNRYVDKISNTDQLLPIKRVSDEQINTFSGMLKRLSLTDKEDDVLLKLVRDKDSATISGKPFMLVIKQLQALFFANLPGARGFRVPEQEPDNEAGTETTSGIKGERK